jgi:hypothetical protein
MLERFRSQLERFKNVFGTLFKTERLATFRRKIRFSRELVPNGVGVREKRREGVGKGAD